MRAENLGIKSIELIRKHLIPDALELLYSYCLKPIHEKQVVQLNARLNGLSYLNNMGLINPEVFLIEMNRIMDSTLVLSYSIRSEGAKKKSLI